MRIIEKEHDYIFNHCTKYLARDNTDGRHSFFDADAGEPRANVAEAWRFPIVDAHDGAEADAYAWNDVTFIYPEPRDGASPCAVTLLSTCVTLYQSIPLSRVGESPYWALTLQVPKGERYRYKFIVDGVAVVDAINPQRLRLTTGAEWSSFVTWAYNQPISFERWELTLLDRLTRHILPFNSGAALAFMQRSANDVAAPHLYKLDVSVGVANYIDKIVNREERHLLYAYKTCLEMIDRILKHRTGDRDSAFLGEGEFIRLYNEMASNAPALFADGWEPGRYSNPSYFLWVLRRHAWTGAFAHPKYGGNPGGMAWDYLGERFEADGGRSAFNWSGAIEPPLGTSTEYRG